MNRSGSTAPLAEELHLRYTGSSPRIAAPALPGDSSASVSLAEDFYAALSAHDGEKVRSLVTPSFTIIEATSQDSMTLDAYFGFFSGVMQALPDFSVEVKVVIPGRDLVAVSWIAGGTHTGPFPAAPGRVIAPTGNRVTVPGASIMEIAEGKISHVHAFWDVLTFLTQLGAI